MPTQSATDFAWSVVGGYPLTPESGLLASDARCWLCGGDTHGQGWPLREAVKPTFTNHNRARCNTSNAVCQPCVAMSSKATWERYVADHPEMGLKTGHAMSWRFYSHLFYAEYHECPDRERHRAILLDPPPPPFLHVIATSGQKHIIFRAQVAHDREFFPVQFEEETVYIQRAAFAHLLADFEAGLAAGISRDDLLTGRYHPATAKRLSVSDWRAIESRVSLWRSMRPQWLRIAHHVARRPE